MTVPSFDVPLGACDCQTHVFGDPRAFPFTCKRADTPPAGRSVEDVTPFYSIDDGAVLNQLPVWAPDPAQRRRIPVDNPARLCAF